MFLFSWSNKRIHIDERYSLNLRRVLRIRITNTLIASARANPLYFLIRCAERQSHLSTAPSRFPLSFPLFPLSPREIKFYSFTLPLPYYVRVASLPISSALFSLSPPLLRFLTWIENCTPSFAKSLIELSRYTRLSPCKIVAHWFWYRVNGTSCLCRKILCFFVCSHPPWSYGSIQGSTLQIKINAAFIASR